MEAFLDYLDATATPTIVPLGRDLITLGSGSTDQLQLPPPAAPRLAAIRCIPGRGMWELSRVSDTGDLTVNRRPVASQPVLLNHLDVISFSGVLSRFIKRPSVPRYARADAPELPLTPGTAILIGRESKANEDTPGEARWDLDPEDSGLSRRHVLVAYEDSRWWIHDLSRSGTELNGANFERRALVIGDRCRVRDYFFEFTGHSLRWVDQASGAHLTGRDLHFSVDSPSGRQTIMNGVNVVIRSGEFLGILGGSGQGKSTLLNLLSGLAEPTSGTVAIDGRPPGQNRGGIGFVPQDDIVHRPLLVREALMCSARLRLLASRAELTSLIEGTCDRLGLREQIDKRVSTLSGGQRKRVNIATELLVRPSVLFLDEPSSGLDPATEEELMTLLQNLRLTGQTIVCTTHVLHKAYLFDRVAFIHGGRLMFLGTASEARAHFLDRGERGDHGTTTGTATHGATQAPLERIYGLFGHSGTDTLLWEKRFSQSLLSPFAGAEPPPPRRVAGERTIAQRPSLTQHLTVLIYRQWAILRSDPRNLAWLVAQSLIIGLLGGWVGRADPEFRFFTCLIATFWFGCSNAAQQIIQELPVFRRERVCGVGLHSYIVSKATFLTLITILQSIVLLSVQLLPAIGVGGDAGRFFPDQPLLTALAFLLASAVGVMLGLTISAHARSNTQAAMIVPLILIPQILFSGFVVPLTDMPAPARWFSSLVPSGAAQRMVDAAWIHHRPLPSMVRGSRIPLFWRTDAEGNPWRENDSQELDQFNTAWQNLAVHYPHLGTGATEGGDPKTNSMAERRDVRWPPHTERRIAGDSIFTDTNARIFGPLCLSLWLALCYTAVWVGLIISQPEAYAPAWARRIRTRRLQRHVARTA